MADSVDTTTFAIDLRSVTRRYSGKAVVDDLTLQAPVGSITGLIGLNGAGKSTLIRMAVGLLRPHAGSLRVAGCDVRSEPVELRRRLGYVPDRPNVYAWMRVREAIGFVRTFHPNWNQPRCDDMSKRLKLPLDKKMKHLSKGQAAKVQLLLAICHDPKVLILDEPTSGFDPLVREEFLEGVLQVAADSGQTVLLSSHALADVQRLADRIAIMHEGKLIISGTTDDLLGRVKRVRVVVDDDKPPLVEAKNLLRQQRSGREWTLTVDDFSGEQLSALKSKQHVTNIDVLDLNLDEVFKDVIRGREEASV